MFKDNSIKSVQDYFQDKLADHFPSREIDLFATYCFEIKFQLTKTDVILNQQRFSESELLWFRSVVKRLKNEEPIQYILGECHFYGLNFFVESGVLIPRPETEELVDIIIQSKIEGAVLDIGTGSGVIPICLAKKMPHLKVDAIDISKEALAIAKRNANQNEVDVNFHLCDVLNEKLPIDSLDVIISNPPYVLESDKNEMANNVLNFEPELALFVDDRKPLIFYQRIIDLCENHLKIGGKLFFEIHENFSNAILDLLHAFEHAEIRKDLQGKDRFIIAIK